MTDLEKEIKRLSNLRQNKKRAISSLEREARINVWTRQIAIAERFTDETEKKLAIQLFDNYLQNFEFRDYNEITLVADLIYEEILKERIQKDINKISEDESNNYISDKIIGSLHSVEDRILSLKERLHISSNQDKDDLTALQELEKKYELYIPFHRNEFTLEVPSICKSCGHEDVELYLIRRRCDKNNFDVLKHPFFSGRFWYNRRGIELVKKGIWTKEEYAFVFYTSPQFVSWCIENEHKIVKIENIEQEKIDNFIKNNPYLKDIKIPSNILEKKKE